MHGFCYARIRANEPIVCTQIEAIEGRNFAAACNSFARSRHATRFGNYQHTNVQALSQRQNNLCGVILGPVLGPIERTYSCAVEQICPEADASSISREALGTSVSAASESQAVDKCLDAASGQYLNALRTAGHTPTCYARPVVLLEL